MCDTENILVGGSQTRGLVKKEGKGEKAAAGWFPSPPWLNEERCFSPHCSSISLLSIFCIMFPPPDCGSGAECWWDHRQPVPRQNFLRSFLLVLNCLTCSFLFPNHGRLPNYTLLFLWYLLFVPSLNLPLLPGTLTVSVVQLELKLVRERF